MVKKTHDLTKKDIEHLAKLSSLELNDSELDKIGKQLNETLDFVENLHELNTDSVDSHAAHVTKTTNVYSEDEVDKSRILTQEQAMQNATYKKNNYFVVKRIL